MIWNRWPVWVSALLLILSISPVSLAQTGVEESTYGPPLPLPMVITGSFGEYRKDHFHGGLDLSTGGRVGYEVYAIAAGYISKVILNDEGYGNVIYLQHEDGNTSIYAHLSAFADRRLREVLEQIREHEERDHFSVSFFPNEFPVERGKVIGFSGESGRGLPHLHLEIRRDDELLNPLKYFYQVHDTQPPIVGELRLVPLGGASFVPAKFRSLQPFPRALGEYEIDRIITGRGRVGLEIKAYDLFNSDAPSNLYGLVLKVDGQVRYQVAFDRLQVDEVDEVGLVYDILLSQLEPTQFYYRLWAPANQVDWIQGDGIIDLDRLGPDVHRIEIELIDIAGNRVTLRFRMKRAEPTGFRIVSPLPQESYFAGLLLKAAGDGDAFEYQFSSDGGMSFHEIFSGPVSRDAVWSPGLSGPLLLRVREGEDIIWTYSGPFYHFPFTDGGIVPAKLTRGYLRSGDALTVGFYLDRNRNLSAILANEGSRAGLFFENRPFEAGYNEVRLELPAEIRDGTYTVLIYDSASRQEQATLGLEIDQTPPNLDITVVELFRDAVVIQIVADELLEGLEFHLRPDMEPLPPERIGIRRYEVRIPIRERNRVDYRTIARDLAGNEAVVRDAIRFLNLPSPQVGKTFRSGSVEITIHPNGLYEGGMVFVRAVDLPSQRGLNVIHAFRLEPNGTLVRWPLGVAVDIPQGMDGTGLGIYRWNLVMEDWEPLESEIIGGRIIARTRVLASYALVDDRSSPRITSIGLRRDIDIRHPDRWRYFAQIQERGSGVDPQRSHLTLDGEPLFTDYDPDRGELFIMLEGGSIPSGEHELGVVTWDRAGNVVEAVQSIVQP
ncbi:MAG: M23 family metallopeptidase [Candidatus Bipolaricaulia bacterium]